MMGRTLKDELLRNFSEGTAPVDSYASAAEPNDNTYPVRMNLSMGEPKDLPSLFSGEHAGPATNLPMTVSQQQIAAENRDRWGNIGPADSEAAAPLLSGAKIVEGDNG